MTPDQLTAYADTQTLATLHAAQKMEGLKVAQGVLTQKVMDSIESSDTLAAALELFAASQAHGHAIVQAITAPPEERHVLER